MLSVANFAKVNDEDDNFFSQNVDDMDYYEESSDKGMKRKFNDETYMEEEEQRDRKPSASMNLNLQGNLDTVVIPREFHYGEQTIQKKGVKATYWCDVCYVELSSHETMKSHSNGAKHQKKVLALKKEWEDKVRRGEKSPDEPLPGIRQVPNPESLKIKIPIRLHERVRDASEPVVGLAFITV